VTQREIRKSDDGGTGEGGTGAEDVLGLENKVTGLPTYKELVNILFSPVFSTVPPSPNFVAFLILHFEFYFDQKS
jgi:hypothetical protein